jgi:hypothetical protein
MLEIIIIRTPATIPTTGCHTNDPIGPHPSGILIHPKKLLPRRVRRLQIQKTPDSRFPSSKTGSKLRSETRRRILSRKRGKMGLFVEKRRDGKTGPEVGDEEIRRI